MGNNFFIWRIGNVAVFRFGHQGKGSIFNDPPYGICEWFPSLTQQSFDSEFWITYFLYCPDHIGTQTGDIGVQTLWMGTVSWHGLDVLDLWLESCIVS